MTDIFELLRAANPVPEPAPLAEGVSAPMLGRIVARDRRMSLVARVRTALTGSRVLAIAGGAVLLAGGTAAAVVALSGQPSAPPTGSLGPLPGVPKPLRYQIVAVPDLNGGAVGWCFFDDEQLPLGTQGGGTCGDVQLPGRPIVASDAGQGAALVQRPRPGELLHPGATPTYVSYAYLAFVTTANVTTVRVAPNLAIRTRPDAQLPNGYRIAIWIRSHLVHRKASSLPRGTPRAAHHLPPIANYTLPNPSGAVALNSSGHTIGLPGAPFAGLHDDATFWQAKHTSGTQPSLHSPPPGACEIDTSSLRDIQLFFGSVVQHVHGFPQLAGRTFLSCAETQFGARKGVGVDAAILLDAQRPGRLPDPIADAVTVRPGIVNAPGSALDQHKSLTARRIGDAWLAIEAGGSLQQRIHILDTLRACVHLGPSPCPEP
ncbi:MAG TPA: hypothetical protein VMU58_03215 [Gaiellaceae bacterium]|nr:hypothetical protein [Gaiellaceae bacterium]